MPFAAGIKFKEDAFSRYFNPDGFDLVVDDFVLVKDRDLEAERVGFVSILEGRAAIQLKHLPRIIRRATDGEVESWYDRKIQEREMTRHIRGKALEFGLPIKISDVNHLEDKRQITIFFTSDSRVDFRALVRDLSGHYKARIEMWQIGVRREAGMKGGMGVCGKELCCSSWLTEFPSISMRHAKDQDIIQPPSKLSGPCGRLRCCLRYEHETYVALQTGAPALGCTGCSALGQMGRVVGRDLLKQQVTLRSEGGSMERVPFAEFELESSRRTGGVRDAETAPVRDEPSRGGSKRAGSEEAAPSRARSPKPGRFRSGPPRGKPKETAPRESASEPDSTTDRPKRPGRSRRRRGARERRRGDSSQGGTPPAGSPGSSSSS